MLLQVQIPEDAQPTTDPGQPTTDPQDQEFIFEEPQGGGEFIFDEPEQQSGPAPPPPPEYYGFSKIDRIPSDLVEAIIQVESGGDPKAVSPAGAQGLAQIMPETARDPGFGVDPVKNPFDPEESRRFLGRYMAEMVNRYDGDYRAALVAYNWGVGNADKWLGRGGDAENLPTETQNYIKKLLPLAQEYMQVQEVGQGQWERPVVDEDDYPKGTDLAAARVGEEQGPIQNLKDGLQRGLANAIRIPEASMEFFDIMTDQVEELLTQDSTPNIDRFKNEGYKITESNQPGRRIQWFRRAANYLDSEASGINAPARVGKLAEQPENFLDYLDPERAAVTVAENLPTLAGLALTTLISGPLGMVVMGSAEGGDYLSQLETVEKNTGMEISPQEKLLGGAIIASLNAALERLPIDMILKAGRVPGFKTKLLQVALSAGSEGVTEGAQGFSKAVGVSTTTGMPMEDIGRNFINDFYAGFLTGGAAGTITSSLGALVPEGPNPLVYEGFEKDADGEYVAKFRIDRSSHNRYGETITHKEASDLGFDVPNWRRMVLKDHLTQIYKDNDESYAEEKAEFGLRLWDAFAAKREMGSDEFYEAALKGFDPNAKLEETDLGQFIGEFAEMTAREMLQLEKAREMENQGYDPERIELATNWFRNPDDGLWRTFSVPAMFKKNFRHISLETFNNEVFTLEDLIGSDHELLRYYPELKDQKVRTTTREGKYKGTRGSAPDVQGHLRGGSFTQFSPDASIVLTVPKLPPDASNWSEINYNAKSKIWDQMEETLAHEVQHKIQTIEGFAQGANPSDRQFLTEVYLKQEHPELFRNLDILKAGMRQLEKHQDFHNTVSLLKGEITWEKVRDNPDAFIPSLVRQQFDRLNKKKREVEEQIKQIANSLESLDFHIIYRRFAGEFEARMASQLVKSRRMQSRPRLMQNIFKVNPDVKRFVHRELSSKKYGKMIRKYQQAGKDLNRLRDELQAAEDRGDFDRADELTKQIFEIEEQQDNIFDEISALGNTIRAQTFLYQDKKGAVGFLQDGRALIKMFEGADFSTFIHESFHVFKRWLTPEELAAVEKEMGIEPGSVWSRKQEEKFARLAEQWVREGKAPTPGLVGAFRAFRNWMVEVYATLKGSEIAMPLSDDMRAIFDSMFEDVIQEAEVDLTLQRTWWQKFIDTFDVELRWQRIGAKNIGFTMKTIFSYRDSMADRGKSILRQSINAVDGDQSKWRQAYFAAQKRELWEEIHAGDDQGLKDAATLIKDFHTYVQQEYYKYGGRRPHFVERLRDRMQEVISDLRGSIEEGAFEGDKKSVLEAFDEYYETLNAISQKEDQLEALDNYFYVHFPVGLIQQRLMEEDPVKAKEILDAIQERMNENPSLKDLVDEGIIDEELIRPDEVLGDLALAAGRDVSILRIRDAAEKEGLAFRRGTQEATEPFVKAPNDAPFFKKHMVHPMLKDWLVEIASKKKPLNVFRKAMNAVKMGAFFNPFFLPTYDLVQAFMVGVNPLKSFGAAWKAVKNREEIYYEALDLGMASTPFDNPFHGTLEEFADELIKAVGEGKGRKIAGAAGARGGRAGAVAYSVLHDAARAFKDHKVTGLPRAVTRILKSIYSMSFDLAWTMDRTVRMATFMDGLNRGMSKREAAQRSATAHADYASLPPETRKQLNTVFFTPTFKVAMGKFFYKSIKALGGELAGEANTTGRNMSMVVLRTSAFIIAMDALMQTLGFERDEFGRRYFRPVQGPRGPKEMVITWSAPHNLWLKYMQRAQAAFGPEVPNSMMRFYQSNKWELHPLLRIAEEVVTNKANTGGKIRYTFDPGHIKVGKSLYYITTHAFAIFSTLQQEGLEEEGREAFAKEYGSLIQLAAEAWPGGPTDQMIEKYAPGGSIGPPLVSDITDAFTFRYLRDPRIIARAEQLQTLISIMNEELGATGLSRKIAEGMTQEELEEFIEGVPTRQKVALRRINALLEKMHEETYSRPETGQDTTDLEPTAQPEVGGETFMLE